MAHKMSRISRLIVLDEPEIHTQSVKHHAVIGEYCRARGGKTSPVVQFKLGIVVNTIPDIILRERVTYTPPYRREPVDEV